MDGTAPSGAPARLPLTALRVWPGNPRKTVDPVALVELATSIVALGGVKTPLLVRPLPTPEGEVTHEVLAGQRRLLAARDAGCVDVPVTIDDLDDAQALELALSENGARRGAPPLEDAEAIERLIVEHGRSEVRAAAILGHSLRWVERRRSLLRLIPEARGWLAGGGLPVGHAEALAAISADAQFTVLSRYRIGADRTTFREVGSLAALAREITYALHLLSSAPFDTADEGLPGGACSKCSKQSGCQRDLFAKEIDAGEHCLDTACWDAKTEAVWAREVKRAKRKKLTVIQDGSEVFTTWGATLPSAPYLTVDEARRQLPNAELKVVAIGRDEKGRVHELVAREAVKVARAETEERAAEIDDEADEDDAQWVAKRDAAQKARMEAAIAPTKSDLAKLRALPLPRLARAALLASDPWELTDAVRVLGPANYKGGNDEYDAWVRGLADDEVVEIALAALALDHFQTILKQHDEATPAERDVYGALLGGEVVTEELATEEPSSVASPPTEAPDTTDAESPDIFYLTRDAWDRLSESGRDQLRRPTGSTNPTEHVMWEERSRFVRSAPLPYGDARWVALSRAVERFGLVLTDASTPSCRACGVCGYIELSGGAWADDTKTVCVDCAKVAAAGLVEIELDDFPTHDNELDIYDEKRIVLWTGTEDNDRIRTIVPAEMAPEVRRRAEAARVKVTAERPSEGPLHVVEIGGMVAAPKKASKILGLASMPEGRVDALVIETPAGPRVAMLDAVQVTKGQIDVFPSPHYVVTQVDFDAWQYTRVDEPPPKGKGKGSKKAAAPAPATESAPTATAVNAPTATVRVEQVPADVLAVISTMTTEGNAARITAGDLERKLYERTNRVLEALGGKWDKKAKAHLFSTDPAPLLEGVMLTGEVARARDVLGYFPTPSGIVQDLLLRADGAPGMKLLEPSAGEGAIVGPAILAGYRVTAVEIDPVRHRALVARYLSGNRDAVGEFKGLAHDVCGDFLTWETTERFDRVVMNPPFAQQQDIDHVTRAFDLLAPGGRLVAVMSAGVLFRDNAKTRDFRNLVWASRGKIYEQPAGSFRSSGTGVSTVVVTMERARRGVATAELVRPCARSAAVSEHTCHAPRVPRAVPAAPPHVRAALGDGPRAVAA